MKLTSAAACIGRLVRSIQALACALLLFGLAAPAQADTGAGDEVVVFGPRTWQRGTGAPDVVRERITLPSGAIGPWLLRMQNGTLDATGRRDTVSSGSLTIDGVQVLGPNDFNRDDVVFEKPINLAPTSQLELRLAGKVGGHVTLTLVGRKPSSVPVAVEPQRLRLAAGAAGQMSVQLAPVPKTPGSLALRSEAPDVARVPAAVSFAAGQERVMVDVEARGYGRSSITASLNGRSVVGVASVTRQPVGVSSLRPQAFEMARGASGTLTVALSAVPKHTINVMLDSSNRTVVTVPSKVTLAAGQNTADIPISALAAGVAQITARLGDSATVSRVQVVASLPQVVSLLPVTSTLALGAQSALQLNLAAAQVTPTTIPLSVTPSGVLSAPSQTVIAAGQTSASVPITATGLGTAGIVASLNGSTAAAAIQVLPPAPLVASLTPPSLTVRHEATGLLRATLNAVQVTPTEITVAAADAQLVAVPATVTVPAGQSGIDIPVAGLALGSTTVSARIGEGADQTVSVDIIPAAPKPVSLLPSPLPLQQGAAGQFTLSLNAAQLDDTTLALSSSAPAIVLAPSQVVVPAGSGSVPVVVSGLATGTATVTAALDGNAVSAEVVVSPPPPAVASLDPSAFSLAKGVPGRLTVLLTRAPVVDTVIALSSSDPLVAEVPVAITVAAGALSAEIPVLARSEGNAEISASLNGGRAVTLITVTAPELVSLTLSPQGPLAYIGESVAFLANGRYTDASIVDITNKVIWSSGNAAVASIASTGMMTALNAGSTAVQAVSGSIVASTIATVQDVPALSFSPAGANLKSGESLALNIASSAPAESGGLSISLAVSGLGSLQVPATVTIPAGQASAIFNITGQAVGEATLTATAPRRAPANARITVLPKIAITALNPWSGPVGIPVTISGTNFDTNAAGNDVRFNGERAVVAATTPTELKVIVPVRATSGYVTVTTALGTATSPQPFNIEGQQVFDIELLPDAVQAPAGGFASVRVQLKSTGLVRYAHAATLSVQGLPGGVTATLERPTVYVGGEATVLLNVAAGVPAGNYTATLSATGSTETGSLIRNKIFAFDVVVGATTVTGRVLHAEDDAPFAGARVRLGSQAVMTDASGYYRFVNPAVLGDQVVLIDGHTANSATAEYPSAIAMPVIIQAARDNLALTSYIQAVDPSKYAAIVPGAKTDVTLPELPNYALNIPQGAVLHGWDGTPITKINVRTVPVDRLPIKPIPDGVHTRSVYLYYFFREGGANPTQPIPVTMANDLDALPGEKLDLWYYDESTNPDANSNQWRIMGQGTVSENGKSVVSDPGVGIPKFCCGASFASNNSSSGSSGVGGDGSSGSGSSGSGSSGSGSSGSGSSGSGSSGSGSSGSGSSGSGSSGSGSSGSSSSSSSGSGNDLGSDGGSKGDQSPKTDPDQPITCKPVDLASGNNMPVQLRHFGIRSLMPVNLTCNYRSTDSRISAFGRGASFDYDWYAEPAGNAIRVTTPQGIRYMLSLGEDGRYRATEGRKRAFGWEIRPNGNGRTLRFKNGEEMDFDLPGRLVTIRSPSGNTIRFERDGNGFVKTATDGAGRVYQFQNTTVMIGRTAYTLVVRITDSLGRSIAFTYDNQTRLTSHTDAAGQVTRYEYDANNRIVKRTDVRGQVLRFTYDDGGRTTAETLEDGTSTIRYDYAAAGNIMAGTRMTDPNGQVTSYRFNGQGYVTRVTDAFGRVVTYNRDFAKNQVLSTIDTAGRITRNTYDERGNATSTRDAQDNLKLYEYSPIVNKVTAITNALGHKTTYIYDTKGRLTSTTDPTGATATKKWLANGLLESETDANGNTIRYSYDAEGNLLSVTDALGRTSEYAYDSANRRVKSTDPLGFSGQTSYDVLDRIADTTDAQGGITHFTYDAEDRLLSVTDPKGNVIEQNAYDARGRLVQRKDAAGLAATLNYDPVGNLLSVIDRKGQVTSYTYDALHRMVRREDPDGRVTSWEYDLPGNIAAIRDNRSGDLLFAYDQLNRPTRIVSDQGTVEYQYDALGRRTQRTVNGGDAVTYQYDKTNRLKQIAYRGKTVSYAWDAGGRLTARTLPNGLVQSYVWDAGNQITSTSLAKTDGTVIEAITYEYDAAGRRTARSATVTDVPETPIEATYDPSNRLVSIAINGQPYALSYDANGNLIKKAGAGASNAADVTTYTWDARNKLTGIQSSAVNASFRYDALGRRFEKTINGDSVQYLYDGGQAIAEIRGNAIAATYLTGLAIDEVIARYSTQGERSLLTDALGSVILAAKEDQSVATAYGYSPYGETQVMGTDEGNPAQYTARENDGTGLYYYRARYYDPVLKRFIAEDPIGLQGGINIYTYVSGNPISRRDPSGLEWLSENFPVDSGVHPNGSAYGAGCGDASSDWFVPNTFPKSCDAHDKCYANQCGKANCDTKFSTDMRNERPDRPGTAWLYHQAVRQFGGNAYRNAGR